MLILVIALAVFSIGTIAYYGVQRLISRRRHAIDLQAMFDRRPPYDAPDLPRTCIMAGYIEGRELTTGKNVA